MAKKGKSSKIRAEFRKRYTSKVRKRDFTRDFGSTEEQASDEVQGERISGKGKLTRKRTIIGTEASHEEAGFSVQLDVDLSACQPGRVLSVHGLASFVELESGETLRCATRGILKSLSTDARHVVVAGDQVQVRLLSEEEGVIQRIEPRTGIISRTSRGKQHIIVANVDQLIIVTSAAQPAIKPNLIDRLLITSEKSKIRPIICINKIDLVDAAELQPLIGVYGQMGYQVILTSVETGRGLEQLKRMTSDVESVVTGQSGVGKSSLLNAIDPELSLRVGHVSTDNQKGRHTTTAAVLLPLQHGGYIVDTPGIRQFQLWDVIAEEVEGFYPDIRPFINLCKFPDCTHKHEEPCAVKDAVADGKLDARRYESYCHLHAGDDA